MQHKLRKYWRDKEMAVTNLALIKGLDGKSVRVEDIVQGVEVYYPSGAGGIVKYKCISITSEQAEFVSEYKEWPGKFTMMFNYPDFDKAEFVALKNALDSFSEFNRLPNHEERQIVGRAHSLGYAIQLSYTQVAWTKEGIMRYNEAVQNENTKVDISTSASPSP